MSAFSEVMDSLTVSPSRPARAPIDDGGDTLSAIVVGGSIVVRRYEFDTEIGGVARETIEIGSPVAALRLAARITKIATDQLAAQTAEDAAAAASQ